MSLQTLILIYVLLIGLVVGSFLNVVIHRLPRGSSTLWPRSRCPRCNAAIRAYDNVPVFSYMLLRGRCRHCGVRIAWRYPMIEALTGLLFVACFLRFGATVAGVAAAGFCAAMVALAGIDLEHFLLPDLITLPGLVLAFVLQPWLPWGGWWSALIGAAAGAGVLLGMALFWKWFRGVEGMGLGDVKMLAMVGAFLGWKGMLWTLFLATMAGSLVGGAMILAGRMRLQSRLPFGFYLAMGAVVALLLEPGLSERLLGPSFIR